MARATFATGGPTTTGRTLTRAASASWTSSMATKSSPACIRTGNSSSVKALAISAGWPSLAAYEKSIEGQRPKDLDGFSPEQRFFLGWAQVWGANQRAETARLQTNTDPHPLPRFRGNGPISNMEAFAKAFGCKKGDAMVREQACKIW